MSLHRTEIKYMGLRLWFETDKAIDQYEEAHVQYVLKRDFCGMLRAAGVDVRAHFALEDKETNPQWDDK